MYALETGKLEILEWLARQTNYAFKFDAKDNQGKTPFIYALETGTQAIVEWVKRRS